MTLPDDVAEFLARHTRAFLLTLRKDGSPTVHPMTGFFEGGRIVMNTYRKSAKARNVERDARAACVVVNGYHGTDGTRAVAVKGRARLRSGGVVALPPRDASGVVDHAKVSGGVAGRVAERLMAGKRVLLEVEPDEAVFIRGPDGP